MPTQVVEARELLSRTPALLDGWLRGLPREWTDATEGPGTYSPRDVIAHLVDNEGVDWIPRMRTIIEAGASRTFTPFKRDAFVAKFAGRTVESLLDAFAHGRAESLRALDAFALTDADLAREGRHPDFGPVTLAQLLATWVTHDLTHIAQIARVMAKRYGAAVGPWRVYIGVLSDRVPGKPS